MKAALNPNYTIGILGGGQLGRMLAFAGRQLGMKIFVLDPDAQVSFSQLNYDVTIG